MYNVYIREAHPSDGWDLDFNKRQGICYKQTHTLEDRLTVARAFAGAMEGEARKVPLVVDDPDTNAIDKAYEAPPERLVVVKDGVVVFKTGAGPFQYSTSKLREFLQKNISGDDKAML